MAKFEIEFHLSGDRGRAALGKKVIEADDEVTAHEMANLMALRRHAYDFELFPMAEEVCFECQDSNRCTSAEKCYALHKGYPAGGAH